MELIKCLTCNKNFIEGNACPQCEGSNLAIFTKDKIIYRGKKYNQRQWYIFLSSYAKIEKEEIILKYAREKISYDYLREIFINNCRRYTFLGLILPSIIFLLIAVLNVVVAIGVLENSNFVIEGALYNIKYFLYFLGALYFSFSVVIFYLWAIKKQRCYLATVKGQTRYVHITKEKYREITEVFSSFKDKGEKGDK